LERLVGRSCNARDKDKGEDGRERNDQVMRVAGLI
jgi:hypothetical protein